MPGNVSSYGMEIADELTKKKCELIGQDVVQQLHSGKWSKHKRLPGFIKPRDFRNEKRAVTL